jgi:hypothetical protein
MKKLVLNFTVLSLSIVLLYAFAQIKSLNALSVKINKHSSCSISDVVEKGVVKENREDSVRQKVIEETIPKFHQQLRAFAPF